MSDHTYGRAADYHYQPGLHHAMHVVFGQRYAVGDLIPVPPITPHPPVTCSASHPAGWRGWHCTREPGHTGRHVNWTGRSYLADTMRHAFGIPQPRQRVRATWEDPRPPWSEMTPQEAATADATISKWLAPLVGERAPAAQQEWVDRIRAARERMTTTPSGLRYETDRRLPPDTIAFRTHSG